MDRPTLFKFGKWIDFTSHTPEVKIVPKGAWSESRDRFGNFKPASIFIEWRMAQNAPLRVATLFKFGKWIDYGKFQPKGKTYLRKGRFLGHVIGFWMKPLSLNFANTSTMASATPRVRNPPPRNGCVVGHVTAV